jgi:hypothetical protein
MVEECDWDTLAVFFLRCLDLARRAPNGVKFRYIQAVLAHSNKYFTWLEWREGKERALYRLTDFAITLLEDFRAARGIAGVAEDVST